MVTDIFGVITDAISSFTTALSTGLTGITAIFYDSTNGFTFLGYLVLIGGGVGLVFWIFYLIFRALHINTK